MFNIFNNISNVFCWWRKVSTYRKSHFLQNLITWCCINYTSPLTRIELTTRDDGNWRELNSPLVMIGIDCCNVMIWFIIYNGVKTGLKVWERSNKLPWKPISCHIQRYNISPEQSCLSIRCNQIYEKWKLSGIYKKKKPTYYIFIIIIVYELQFISLANIISLSR